jgi:hypothetical protein
MSLDESHIILSNIVFALCLPEKTMFCAYGDFSGLKTSDIQEKHIVTKSVLNQRNLFGYILKVTDSV